MESWSSITGRFTTIYPVPESHLIATKKLDWFPEAKESWRCIISSEGALLYPSPRIAYRHQEINLIFRSKGDLKHHHQTVHYYIPVPESLLIATKKLDLFSEAKEGWSSFTGRFTTKYLSPRISSYCHQEIRLIFRSNLQLTIISTCTSQSQSSDRYRGIWMR